MITLSEQNLYLTLLFDHRSSNASGYCLQRKLWYWSRNEMSKTTLVNCEWEWVSKCCFTNVQ